jgi:hypothetical protein
MPKDAVRPLSKQKLHDLLRERTGLCGASNFLLLEAVLYREQVQNLEAVCGSDEGTKAWVLRSLLLLGLADAIEAVVPIMYLEELNSYVGDAVRDAIDAMLRAAEGGS